MKRLWLIPLFCSTMAFAQVKGDIQVPFIDFPMAKGKGLDTVQANCLMCHSFGYVLNQGKQPRKFWHEKIEKMRKVFKAPISDEDAKIIEEYLFKHYGNGKAK